MQTHGRLEGEVEVVDVKPDDFLLPWEKGLFCDVCDIGCFFGYAPKPPYEFGPVGRAVASLIHRFGMWHSCAGSSCICRAVK